MRFHGLGEIKWILIDLYDGVSVSKAYPNITGGQLQDNICAYHKLDVQAKRYAGVVILDITIDGQGEI